VMVFSIMYSRYKRHSDERLLWWSCGVENVSTYTGGGRFVGNLFFLCGLLKCSKILMYEQGG